MNSSSRRKARIQFLPPLIRDGSETKVAYFILTALPSLPRIAASPMLHNSDPVSSGPLAWHGSATRRHYSQMMRRCTEEAESDGGVSLLYGCGCRLGRTHTRLGHQR